MILLRHLNENISMILKVSDCCFALGFSEHVSELCHNHYSIHQWNTETSAASCCTGTYELGSV